MRKIRRDSTGRNSRTRLTVVTGKFATLVMALLCSSQVGAVDIYDYARRLGQGLNLGNALEAPNEGGWGFRLQSSDFRVIADGGFDSIRVPIRWSSHAAIQPTNGTYPVDSSFFDRIDWVVEQAKQQDLAVVLNVHHYDELNDAPDSFHRQRYLSIWEQISERYQDESNLVYFELLNEPHTPMSDSDWNLLLRETLATVRETNPVRPVIIGGTRWNSYRALGSLELPADDRNIIGTFHYYSPFQFTHQGAEWVDGSDAWLGTTWTGTESQKRTVESHFDQAVAWATESDRPVYLGEFGAYSKADIESRAAWTEFIVQAAESRGISWSYWEYAAGFGVYDRDARQWVSGIYDAISVDPKLPKLELPPTSCATAN